MKQTWLMPAIILGLSFFIAIFLVKPIGVSTQFSVLGGMIQSVVDPSVIIEDNTRESGYRSTNAYYDKDEGKLAKEIKNPINYDFIFVVAIPFGAFVANLLNKKRRGQDRRTLAEERREHPSFYMTYGRSFITGFLLLFGARMAGGCTSGHMMSGIMQGSISGYLFAAVVFPIAILLAITLERRG